MTVNTLDELYRERARLIAYIACGHPFFIVANADPAEPEWPVIYIHTPAGQLSWHLSPRDLDLFEHLDHGVIHHHKVPEAWDGHTTEDKYHRLEQLIKRYHRATWGGAS